MAGETGNAKVAFAGAIIGLLTGVVGLATAMVGAEKAGVITVVAGGSIPTATQTVTVAPTAGPTLVENQVLSNHQYTVYRQGTLVFQTATYTDLDADPSDKQWGRIGDTENGKARDVSATAMVGGTFSLGTMNETQYANIGQAQLTPESCDASSAYSKNNASTGDLLTGGVLCFITSEGRLAGLKLIDANKDAVTFDAVVWNRLNR